MISRTLRAFSRAARRQERMELGLSLSNVRNFVTASLRRGAAPLGELGVVPGGGHERFPLLIAGPAGASSMSWKFTSTKRATFSARST